MTNASPFKPQVCHSIDRPSGIQTGWTLYKYNGCVSTGFCHSHCQCQLQEGIQCPQEDHVRLEVSVGHYDGRFTTFGICWGCLRNTMRTPCSKHGGMVHRGDKDLRSGTITRTRKRIMIHSLTFSSVSHKYEHLSFFSYFTRQWRMAKLKRYDGWSYVIAWLFVLITPYILNNQVIQQMVLPGANIHAYGWWIICKNVFYQSYWRSSIQHVT